MTSRRRLIVSAAFVSGFGVVTVCGLAGPSGATQRTVQRERPLIGLPRGAALVSQRLLPGGQAFERYRYDGGVFTVVAPRGSSAHVSIHSWDNGQDGTATGSVTVPNQKTAPTSGVTPFEIYADAIAAGMPKAEAKSMMTRAERAESSARTSAHTRTEPQVTLQPPTSASTTASSGNSAESCDAPEVVQKSGNDWWIGDEITTSGHYDSTFEGLEKVSGRDNYTAGNKIDAWQPNESIASNCNGSTTVSLTFAGVGLSSSANACGGSISPTSASPTTGEGSYWNGCSGATQGAPEVDGLYSPSTAEDSYNVDVSMSWGACYT
jgi:hypothetical protein